MQVSALTLKHGQGKTGVEFYWFPQREWKALSEAQRQECLAWQKTELGQAAIKQFKQDRNKWKHPRVGGDNKTNPKVSKLEKAVRKVHSEDKDYLNEFSNILGENITEVCKHFATALDNTKRTANIQKTSGLILMKLVTLRPGGKQHE